MEPASPRGRVIELTRKGVDGCFVTEHDTSPIVACARHKALAIDAALCALATNEEAALSQIETTRNVAIAVGHPEKMFASAYEARVAEVRAAAATKRVALQTDAVAADAALEGALAAVAALSEVRVYSRPTKLPSLCTVHVLCSLQAAAALSDAELAAQESALAALESAARSAVAAIPVSPATSASLSLAFVPSSPEALRAADAGALFGQMQVAPVFSRHVHSPHCGPACDIRFDPHAHSAGCNHGSSLMGEVWSSATRGDFDGLEAALAAGGSTEEANAVRVCQVSCAESM